MGTDPVADGDPVQMTFDVSLDGFASTKAYSDGATVNKLAFLVYDQNGEQITGLTNLNVGDFNPSVTTSISVSLVKGVKYNFVFFAQKDGHYTIDAAAKTLTVANPTGMMNDDGYDAFYASVRDYTVPSASFTESVKLKRPFAQINVGATDYTAATANGFDLSTLETAYTLDVPTSMNLLTGAVEAPVTVTGTLAAAPSALATPETLTVSNSPYGYMSMAYVLCDPAGSTADLKLRFKAKQNGNPLTDEVTRTFSAIPLKRNFRTNILGAILTTTGNFNVTIEHVYDEVGTPGSGAGIQVVDAANVAAANELFDASLMITYGVNILSANNEDVVKLPKTSEPVYVGFNIDNTAVSLTVKYADDATASEKPSKVYIYAKNTGSITADLEAGTTYLVAGSTVNGIFHANTEPTTLIIQPTAKIIGTVVSEKGSIVVEGTVNGNVSSTDDTQTTITVTSTGKITGTLTVPSNTQVVTEPSAKVETLALQTGASGSTVSVLAAEGTITDMGEITPEGEVFMEGVYKKDGEFYIYSKEGLMNMADGSTSWIGTYHLLVDIDLEDATIPSIICGSKFVFDGGEKTVSHATMENVDVNTLSWVGGFFNACNSGSDVTVKDLTLDGITVPGSAQCGVVLGYTHKAKLSNVHVKNSSVKGVNNVGGLIGHSTGNDAVVIENCSVENTLVSTAVSGGQGNAGALVGAAHKLTVTGTRVSNCEVRSNYVEDHEEGWIHGTFGKFIGTYQEFTGCYLNISGCSVENVTLTPLDEAARAYTPLNDFVGGWWHYADASAPKIDGVAMVWGLTSDGHGNYSVAGETNKAIAGALNAITQDTENPNPVITVTGDNVELTFGARVTAGNASTETITIDGGGHTITFGGTDGDWSSIGSSNGKLIIKNATINYVRKNGGNNAWNNHALIFSGQLEAENVTFNNSVCVGGNASFSNCKFSDSGAFYSLLMKASAPEMTVTNCTFTATNGGRGIKVIDEYVDAADRKQVSITVSGCAFETAKKAAILVTNTAGAKITWGEGNDISKVAADTENAVWNDEDRNAAYDLVEVTGCTKKQE